MVSIELSDSEALVLFEFLSRYDDRDELRIDDPSEQYALWALHCRLETQLAEPFKADYAELLTRARDELRSKYGGENAG